MASSYVPGIFTSKNRLFGLWLAAIILLSSLVGIGWSALAEEDNVYVDGYVKDSGTGLPIDNAAIILQNPRDGRTNATQTNMTGHYNLSIHSPVSGDVFVIIAFHEDYLINSTYIWLSPWNNRTNYNISLDPATQKDSHVHGKVWDAVTMNPLPWSEVAAIGDNYINTTGTNATGYYWMKLESNQTYVIQAGKDGYENQRNSGYFNWGDNLTFNFLLEPTNCTLKGYVKNSTAPLGMASVMVYRLDEFSPIEYMPIVNSTAGYFELNLSRGVWQIEVQEDMHFTQTLTVLMFNGQTTWQNFTLAELPSGKAQVQGYVRYYHNGSGVPWCGVSARNLNDSWGYWDGTNSTGWYNFSVITGEITLSAWASGYAPADMTLSAADGEIYFINLTIFDRIENGYLDGYVKVNGTGEEGVDIVVYYGWWQYWEVTDINGYYNITVPGGPLYVQAIKYGFKTAFHQINTTSFQTTRLNITIEPLNWSCELRGYLNNTNDDPIDGAFVFLDYDGFGDRSTAVLTDYTGFYQQMAPAGHSSYYMFADEHEYLSGEVNLPADQMFWLNESLTPVGRNAKIICRFTNIYSGAPLKRMRLTLSEQELIWFEDVETDANGMIRASVPAGFVRIGLNAWDNGFKNPGMYQDPGMLQFRIRPGETRWLNISLFPRMKTALLHGYVNDTGGFPISGAKIFAEYGDTIITDITDSSGYYELSLPGDHSLEAWVRAPGYKTIVERMIVGSKDNIWYDWVLEDSNAWIEGPVTDSVADVDGDSLYDVLYVNVTVNVTVPGRYRVEGNLMEGRNFQSSIARAEAIVGESPGIQTASLVFMGEQIRSSGKDGYFVKIELLSDDTWEMLDKAEHFTAKYAHDEFDLPDTTIEIPVEQWLVDTDFDGLYNYLVINITLNVSVAGDYVLMGVLRDIWGDEFEPELELLTLETGIQEVQISFEGTYIYNNGEKLGSCYIVLFEDMPETGNEYIDGLFFYTPYEYEIFQRYTIDSYVSGYVTDINDQPIEGIEVMLYNTTFKFLNSTKTDASGHYELGGWDGEWMLVVDDSEDEEVYQGNLNEITLTTGTNLKFDVRNLAYTLLDRLEVHFTFSDWNNTHVDWLFYAEGDNETIRFMFDVLQFGDGDGFVSEEEAELIMSFIGGMNLSENSIDAFLVDGIWYDLDLSSETFDAGLVGPVTSEDPIYVHMTGNYTSNSTIPDPSPHELQLNCSYDDTAPESLTDNNATYAYHIAVPPGWGRTGNGATLNVTISGIDYVTVDPQGDPDEFDENLSEWVNLTVSSGITPTYCSIKGNVTLQGSSHHSGVMVTVYDNATQQEMASDPTDPSGGYEILGLNPSLKYDVVAYKAGYNDNRSNGHTILAGEILWLDFTLYSDPPVISHTPIPSALLGDTIEIYADVTDDGKVGEVLLYYQDVGSGTYAWTNMSRIASTSTFMGTIPAQSLAGYLYYYIWANDTKENYATHPDVGNHTVLIYELDPPVISNVIALPDSAEYPKPINVSAEVNDGYKVEIVSLFIEMPDSSTTNKTMEHDLGTGRYYLNISYPMLGTYNFTIWAKDTFNNWNSFSGSFETQDTISPTSNVEPIAQYWFNTSPITLNAVASDSGIGVASLELWYQNSTDNSSWSGWTLLGADTAAPWSWSFDFPNGDGYYEFFSIANDNAGNSETMKVSAEALCGYDTTAPISSVDIIDPYWHITPPITITATASSSMSVTGSVELWYRYSDDNSTWGIWTSFSIDTVAPWSWVFDFPNGEGFYEFYSIATDLLGNVEAATGLADAKCAFDISNPLISSFSVDPDPCELGQIVDIFSVLSDLSGIGGAWVELSLDDSLIGNFSMSITNDNYWYLYTPDEIGILDVVVWMVDNNDHWNSKSDSILVQDTMPPSIINLAILPPNPQVGSDVRVSVDVSDASGIATCTINITTPDGDWLLNESMINVVGTDTFYYETDYNILGEYQFVIWVVDDAGLGASMTDTFTTQDSSPPNADAGPAQQVTVGSVVTLDASPSTDNYGISNYTWSFNDNGLRRFYGMITNYTFGTIGNYEITLTVTDFGGNIDTATTWVNVSAVSGTGSVTGTVLDEDGNPIDGATVYVEGHPSVQNTTDSLGRFVLEDVPIGSQRIIVVKDGFKRDYQDVNVQQDQTTVAGDIELAKSVSEEPVPWAAYAVLGVVAAIVALLALLFLMKRKQKPEAVKTVIDEVFFMYNDGRLIQHLTRRLRPDMDEDILSSMLVAVQDFIKDSFSGHEGILDEMKFGRFQILLGRGKYIILATIVLGEELEPFRPQVTKCVEDIEEKYAEVLENWNGDLSALKGASKYVLDLIDGRYA